MLEIENDSLPVNPFFTEPQPNKRKTTVVYLDGSHGRLNGVNCIGVGVFMINEDASTMKLANGYYDSKNKSAVQAEKQTLIDFVSFVHEHGLHKNTDFIIYGDSEPIINYLNLEDFTCCGALAFKKEFIDLLKNVSIKGAYWVKGHGEELGNLVVDSLAINSMKYAMFKNKDLKSFYENTPIVSLLEGFMKRCPELVRQEKDEYLFNQKCFVRHLDTHKNIINKELSNELHEKNKLVPIENGFNVNIESINTEKEERFIFTHQPNNTYTKAEILKQLLGDLMRIKQIKVYLGKPVSVYISSKEMSDFYNKTVSAFLNIKEKKKKAILTGDEESLRSYREEIKLFLKDSGNRQISDLYRYENVKVIPYYQEQILKKKIIKKLSM